MIPDSITLASALVCFFAALIIWGHDRHLEPADDTEPHDDYDTRRDEWAEDQAINQSL